MSLMKILKIGIVVAAVIFLFMEAKKLMTPLFVKISKIAGIIIAVFAVSAVAKKLLDLSFVDIFTMFSAMTVAVSAATTAFFAYNGLSIWKEQHSGKIESDLATRLLASIYRYRDAMEIFMRPLLVEFIPESHEEAPHLSKKQRYFRAYQKFEQKRYDKVISARQKFYDDLLTSEALWGEKMRSIAEEMYRIENVLQQKIRRQLIIQDPDAAIVDKNTAEYALEKVLKSDDELSKEFAEKVKKAEDYLKPKILTQNPNPPTQHNPRKGTK